MSQYTTGEITKECGISVRTVQFYDTKGLLEPSELTDGGRRIYSDEDLKQMRLICMLKSFGLSLDAIKDILKSADPAKILLLMLDEQIKNIDREISDMQNMLQSAKQARRSIAQSQAVAVNSISGIECIMKSTKKLRKTQIVMLAVGIIVDAIGIGTVYYWIKYGNWVPFAVAIPFVILAAILLVVAYYKNAAYICAGCSGKFQPKLWEFVFAAHTPKTRKLTCTQCGTKGWCVETSAD